MPKRPPLSDEQRTITDARAQLSAIVRDVAATGTHVAVGSYGSPQAVIVPAAEALPPAALSGLIICAAETTGVTIADSGELPHGIPELLTWWSSLTPTPTHLHLFLTHTIDAVKNQGSVNTSTAKRLTEDTIRAYTGWSHNDWVAHTAH